MNRRPLHYVTREKEEELIQKLLFLVDNSNFDPSDTVIVMASPDYSATVAMHLAHAWSRNGDIIPIIPVEVPYPDESPHYYINKLAYDLKWHKRASGDALQFKKVIFVEAGVIRGTNWRMLHDVFSSSVYGIKRENMTFVSLLENVHSTFQSDYVAEYYDDETHELVFYYEKFNKHWPVR